MSGMTPTGFEVPTIEEIVDEMAADLRDAINPALDTGPTSVIGQIIGVLAERERDQWLAQRDVWQSFSPSASGQSLTQVALLTGTIREEATKSRVTASVTLNAGVTLPAGSRARTADLTAVFETTEDVTNGGGSPATLPVVMEAVDAGPTRANSGTLTVRVTPVSGWTAVTNALDAEVGLPDESDTNLRTRRELELRVQGSSNLDATIADVSRVEGVVDVAGEENDTDVSAGGLDPHSFRIVVWDGDPEAAEDEEIAQAIWNSKPSGIPPMGSITANAVDAKGGVRVMRFDRASEVEVWLEFDVEVSAATWPTDGEDQVADVIVDYADLHWKIGQDVYLSALYGSVFGVSGVIRITAVRAGLSSNPVGTSDLSIAFDEIARADTARIEVNVTVV